MCKKLAEGLDALVLDVKCGSGTSMQTAEDARRLASSMAHLGQKMGVTTSALISNMDQPLGKMLGNAVEVNEAVDILEGKGPDSVRAITIALGCEALLAAKIESETEAAKTRLASLLDSGQAREKFSNMVTSQGGDLDAPRKVAKSLVLCSKQSGFVHAIHAGTLGRSVVQLGGGRQTLGGAIDRSVGIELCVEVGDAVDAGQELVRIFASSPPEQPWIDTLYDAIEINPQSSKVPPLIIDRVTSDGHPIQD